MSWGLAQVLAGNLAARFAADLACDRAMPGGRGYDVDGRLHITVANISKAAVNPYRGEEIPEWQDLGLQPSRVYQMFRDPEELKKSASSFDNIPILSRHIPVTAVDHSPNLVIGATGSDAAFEAPFLTNSLVIWTQAAIDAIESGATTDLSAAYRYEPDMTAGSFEGQRYDGVMRRLVGNHVALVDNGRVAGAVIGDAAMRSRKFSTPAHRAVLPPHIRIGA